MALIFIAQVSDNQLIKKNVSLLFFCSGDIHSRRLTLAELQKLQQQAPIVDSRHAELLKPRLLGVTARSNETAVVETAVNSAKPKIEFDYDLELGVEV